MSSMPVIKVDSIPAEENNNSCVVKVEMLDWNSFMKDNMGYEAKTTFWCDFSIAERFGVNGVRETFERVMDEWKNNYVYLTELVLVLNHKIWFWHGEHNDIFSTLYDELWRKADSFACDNLKGEELSYFYDTTD